MSKIIQEGSFALNFTMTDVSGKTINLSDYKGKKIILSFYRNVSCPFCNRRIHAIMGNNLKLQDSGVQLVFMFESTNQKLSESVFHKGINPWPLVGDPEKTVYKKYGVEPSLLKTFNTFLHSNILTAMADTKALQLPKDDDATQTLIPADFFIDENFKIVRAHYGKHLDDHVSLEDFKQFAGID